MANQNDDRRRDPRVRVKVRLEAVDTTTGRPHVMHTTNLSIGGARCFALTPPAVEAVLEGHLYLPLSEAGRDVDVAIPVRARVLRHLPAAVGRPHEVALVFDALSEANSAELASYLFDWLADDSWSHASLVMGAAP